MAKIPQYPATTITVAAGVTQFISVSAGGLNNSTTEANVLRTCRTPGRYSNLKVLVTANTIVGDSTITFRKNGGDGNQTKTITGLTANVFEDTVNVDDLVDGDTFCIAVAGGVAGTSLTITIVGCCFAATTNTVTTFSCSSSAPTTDSTSLFARINGVATNAASETIVTDFKFKTAGTLKRMGLNIPTNARTTTTTFGIRVAAATKTLTIPVTTGGTGWWEDTTHSDAVAVDEVVSRIVTLLTGGGAITHTPFVDFETTTTAIQMITANTSGSIGPSVTQYNAIQGRITASATQGPVQVSTGVPGVFSLGNIVVDANGNTGTSVATLQKGGADTALTITFTTATGAIDDNGATVTTDGTELFNWKVVTGASGANLTFRALGIKFTPTAASSSIAAISSGHHQRGLR